MYVCKKCMTVLYAACSSGRGLHSRSDLLRRLRARQQSLKKETVVRARHGKPCTWILGCKLLLEVWAATALSATSNVLPNDSLKPPNSHKDPSAVDGGLLCSGTNLSEGVADASIIVLPRDAKAKSSTNVCVRRLCLLLRQIAVTNKQHVHTWHGGDCPVL